MTKIITFLTMFLFLWTGNIYSQDNQLTAKEKKEGWVLLFNGKNLDGWTSVGKDTPPAFGWVVEDVLKVDDSYPVFRTELPAQRFKMAG